jgi:hypothetical protein
MEALNEFFLDPNSDEGQYRLIVWRLLINNPSKYPEFTKFIEAERKNGTAHLFCFHLGMTIGTFFKENVVTAACAQEIEALVVRGRKAGEELYLKYFVSEERETKH